jgi:hypothetical protein
MESPELLDGIVKYIDLMYHPIKIVVDKNSIWGSDDSINDEIVISVYVDSISDDYITNPQSSDIKKHKEKRMEYSIRRDIFNYFGVKTSGLSFEGFSPYIYNGLTIDVLIWRM